MDKKGKRYRELVEKRLSEQGDPDLDAAVRDVSELLADLGDFDEDLMEAVRSELTSLVEARVRSIKDPYLLSRNRPSWYDENDQRGVHWPALSGYLINEKGWDETVITESISPYSAKVVGELGDPRTTEFDVRGLVVGYVQSGKTANMTGVIARAVDAGYNIVVVLAGLTDKLRHQTQKRLEKDLVQRNPNNWHPLTKRNKYDASGSQIESGEFQDVNQLPRLARGVAMLAVVKKNPRVLERLISGIGATPQMLRNKLRLLVIDDEADQAGPNAGKTDEDPAVTNRTIRKLLTSLNTVSYVGYTATPYANILIRPGFAEVFDTTAAKADLEDDDEKNYWSSLEDLYPRDFVIALPRPEGYFGAEQVFGRSPVDAEDEGTDGLDIIRQVEDEEVADLKDLPDDLEIDDISSLRTAVRWFVLAVAARLARGQTDEHQSMLIHTSHLTLQHAAIQKLVEPEIAYIKENYRSSDLRRDLERLWAEEIGRVPAEEFGNRPTLFADLEKQLPQALERLVLVVENSASEDRLSYDGESGAVVAIGGNILSRGLTLEGLMTTYFTRSSKQYDTLLQMGRWFGYREGYEDLVRLWMPDSLATAFRQLALVEHELREEIGEYALNRATPLDFAVRIRTLPGLQITGRNKMRHAVTARLDYQGLHLQTIRFPRKDRGRLKANWKAGARLAEIAGLTNENLVGLVDAQSIIGFFRDYYVDPSHRDLRSGWLEKYISENYEFLGEWSVGIFQPENKEGETAKKPLGSVVPRLINRSRLNSKDKDIADIKALMSRADVLFDVPLEKYPDAPRWRTEWSWPQLKDHRGKVEEVGRRPLLLLYPIDRKSKAKSDGRLPLKAKHDVLGFGLVFPQLGIGANKRPTRYIQVDMTSVQQAGPDEDDS